MIKTDSKSRILAVLVALGFTPETLAVDLAVSVADAKRILSPGATLMASELLGVSHLLGIEPSILCGVDKPGEIRHKRFEREREVL